MARGVVYPDHYVTAVGGLLACFGYSWPPPPFGSFRLLRSSLLGSVPSLVPLFSSLFSLFSLLSSPSWAWAFGSSLWFPLRFICGSIIYFWQPYTYPILIICCCRVGIHRVCFQLIIPLPPQKNSEPDPKTRLLLSERNGLIRPFKLQPFEKKCQQMSCY